jgi:hypothetical protein
MTEDSAHGMPSPEDSVEGAAETAARTVGPQPHEGLVEPGGVETEDTR